MDWLFVTKVLVALLPVVIALLLFDRLDVFDLVSFRGLLFYILCGALIAAAAYSVNGRVMDGLPIGRSGFSRFIAPFIEESLKAAFIMLLFAANRIGFKLDAAVIGFAVGAGFSILENIFYLHTFPGANLGVWMVRGMGTAIMHGGAVAIFAVVTHEFTERQAGAKAHHYSFNPLLYLPGLAAATAVHTLFNQFPNEPLLAMLGALVLVPITLFMVFSRSEGATHQWLTADYESHTALLADIRSGAFEQSPAGKEIARLAKRYRHATAADIFNYIGLHMELVLRAEHVLLERAAGRDAGVGETDAEMFKALRDLEKHIGRAVLAALRPHLVFTRNDLWEMRQLEAMTRVPGEAKGKSARR